MNRMKYLRLLAVLAVLAMLATACNSRTGDDADEADGEDTAAADSGDDAEDDGGDAPAGDGATIEYWLWDANQQPFYEECATAFTDETGINIEISQFGWGDYWTNLTTSFASDTAPDVFTNHLARYPEQVESGVLLPLNDFIDGSDVDTEQYFAGLAELWVVHEGDRFGLPKDFDTVALVLNTDALEEAGLSTEDAANLDWNPDDGGSFGEFIAQLSVDGNCNTGTSPDFDPSNVTQYGFGIEGPFGAFGQTTFSGFAVSNGYQALNENPFGDQANFDSPELHATIQWFADNIEAGFITPIEDVESLGGTTLFQNGTAATMTNGSWMINTLTGDETEAPVEFAPLPEGPTGESRSMFNGLADSITQSAEDPEAAWQWVEYLASTACQDVIGEAAVVFPAIPSSAEIAQNAHESNGVDVSAFTSYVENDTTFLFPITDSASQIEDIVGPVMQQILRGEVSAADGLGGVADQVNSILGS